jgi:hypothetical protein
LYTSRHVIDQDIKAHGNDKREDKTTANPAKGKSGVRNNKYASSYAVNTCKNFALNTLKIIQHIGLQ